VVPYAYPYFTLRGSTNVVPNTDPVYRESSYLKDRCTPCDFKPAFGTYLGGCANNCIDYPTLELAQDACRALSSCKGVTFSRKYIGGSASTDPIYGKFGF